MACSIRGQKVLVIQMMPLGRGPGNLDDMIQGARDKGCSALGSPSRLVDCDEGVSLG